MSFLKTERCIKVESNVANVGNFNPDNGLNVNNWNRDNGNDNVWASPLIVSGNKFMARLAWRLLSILQAFCQFPVIFPEVLSNYYCLALENP
ncbi:MAG: hypothetical protein A3B38_03095 [Candidatus Levybacteria bacterium RIFCSPLOWO2_01_FULL_36_13]|nr:MAG: hypothetical protein A3B38_03095 [Candidatus Levybacteria bacterium RIFCSPLOWO2_01_FULL_36_13]